ncbi:MAG: universal stress protein, partial [Chloroflexia bacterium]|nr:universal stress protein [Chloroflexia bacterium]
LAPIDGSAAAVAALPVAAALAGALGGGIRVVQAVAYRPEADPPLAANPEIAHPDTIEREFRGAPRAAAEAAVAEALARLQALGVSATGEILTGNPVAAVISEAGRTELVVLTSRGMGRGEAGASDPPVSWTLGGVADKLLRAGTVAMVLVPASTGTGT